MLKEAGPNERIFKEIQEIDSLNFKYKEEPQPMDNVSDLAESMHIYPSDQIMTGSELLFDYDSELYASCAQKLSPEKVGPWNNFYGLRGEKILEQLSRTPFFTGFENPALFFPAT